MQGPPAHRAPCPVTIPPPQHNRTRSMVEALGLAIVTDGYDADTPFPIEAELCEQFDASRTVVREAVKMLTAKGLLSARPGGGNVVEPETNWNLLDPDVLRWMLERKMSPHLLLEFTQMRVVMEGPLAGEIVTRVRFDGVSQGEGAKKNFVTRQLAKLPIQFRINISAQFYQLLTSLKALYDPAAVRDPRELGLLSDDGTRFLRRSVTAEEVKPEIDPDDVIPDEPTIQDQESE